MIYTDGIHMIGSSIKELHEFAKQIGLHKCFYRYKTTHTKKKRPHYDLMNNIIKKKAINSGAILVSKKEIVLLCKKIYGD